MVRSLFELPSSVLVLTSALPPLAAAMLELKSEKQNAHASSMMGSISSVQFSPDGLKIVSGGIKDKTIKVWDSGAFPASNRLSLAKTDSCWLVWQLHWIS